MDAQLKQRVVGAAVLVAVGVIFIPLLLDNAGENSPAIDLGIESEPPANFNSRVVPIDDATMERMEAALDAPAEAFAQPPLITSEVPLELVAEPEAAVPDGNAPESEVTPASDFDEAKPVAESVTEPAPAAAPTRTGVTAWVVQLGSFVAQKNAEGLIERLKDDGYTAFIEPLRDADVVSYRVRVGPELTKLTAERIRDELEKKVEIKGIVMRYP